MVEGTREEAGSTSMKSVCDEVDEEDSKIR